MHSQWFKNFLDEIYTLYAEFLESDPNSSTSLNDESSSFTIVLTDSSIEKLTTV